MEQWTLEAVELLRDVEKSTWLPPAQPEKVRIIVDKMVTLYQRGTDLQSADDFDGTQTSVMAPRVYMLTLARLQRCLLAYLRVRMERIEALRWDVAGILPDENKAMLSENELNYAEGFNELLGEFQTAYDLDLTRDFQPPEDLYVRVNVLQNIGQCVLLGPQPSAGDRRCPPQPTDARRCTCHPTGPAQPAPSGQVHWSRVGTDARAQAGGPHAATPRRHRAPDTPGAARTLAVGARLFWRPGGSGVESMARGEAARRVGASPRSLSTGIVVLCAGRWSSSDGRALCSTVC